MPVFQKEFSGVIHGEILKKISSGKISSKSEEFPAGIFRRAFEGNHKKIYWRNTNKYSQEFHGRSLEKSDEEFLDKLCA